MYVNVYICVCVWVYICNVIQTRVNEWNGNDTRWRPMPLANKIMFLMNITHEDDIVKLLAFIDVCIYRSVNVAEHQNKEENVSVHFTFEHLQQPNTLGKWYGKPNKKPSASLLAQHHHHHLLLSIITVHSHIKSISKEVYPVSSGSSPSASSFLQSKQFSHLSCGATWNMMMMQTYEMDTNLTAR